MNDLNFSNENIPDLTDEDRSQIQANVRRWMQGLLESLRIDTVNDHNTMDTADRVAKMLVHEVFSGRFYPPPKITSFPNAKTYDQLYVSGPITVRSMCAHHWMPIKGKAYIGVYPGTEVIGLSKFNRIVDWFASRPQIQEEMTVQIADYVEKATKAEGVAVLMQAEHFCMTHRGVREHESDMTTSVMLGRMRDDPSLKQEFFAIVEKMK
jgi:GTP cyclohydrolase IA